MFVLNKTLIYIITLVQYKIYTPVYKTYTYCLMMFIDRDVTLRDHASKCVQIYVSNWKYKLYANEKRAVDDFVSFKRMFSAITK